MNKFLMLLGIIVLNATQIAVADDEKNDITTDPMIVSGKVGIKNLERQSEAIFSMRKPGQRWEERSLGPSETQDFPCGKTCDIHIGVKGKPPVERRLTQTKRYAVFWDKKNQNWNVNEAN